MRKKYINILITIAFFLGATPKTYAQIVLECETPRAQIDLDINNVRAKLLQGGMLFYEVDSHEWSYEVPKGSGISALLSGGLWMGGIDEWGELRVAAQTYRRVGADFWAGPAIYDPYIGYSSENCSNFNRFWKVYGSTIDSFRTLLTTENLPLATSKIPNDILQWAGKNNPHFSDFALPQDWELAPFWDADNDGNYNPQMGDYPVLDACVEGVYADQMVWWIFNDVSGGRHEETRGSSIGVEVSVLAYAFVTDDALNDATFYQYNFHNSGLYDFDTLYFGHHIDPDLGDFSDDFVGCNVEENMAYVYNGRAVDEQYGDQPPYLGIKIVEGLKDEQGEELGLASFLYYIGDNTSQGKPLEPSDYYGFLRGYWRDDQPLTYGGSGRLGDTPHPYLFSGEPSDPEGWSECSFGNEPADRRFVMSMGGVGFKKGERKRMTLGIVWVQPPKGSYPCPDMEPLYLAGRLAKDLHQWERNCPIVSSTHNTTLPSSIRIFPNPTNSTLSIVLSSQLEGEKATTLTIYNVLGKKVMLKTLIVGQQQTLEIDISQLESGTYLLSLSNDTKIWTERLLIL